MEKEKAMLFLDDWMIVECKTRNNDKFTKIHKNRSQTKNGNQMKIENQNIKIEKNVTYGYIFLPSQMAASGFPPLKIMLS